MLHHSTPPAIQTSFASEPRFTASATAALKQPIAGLETPREAYIEVTAGQFWAALERHLKRDSER